MTKYRNSNAPASTSTYNRTTIETPTENIYEALSIIAKRSNQINLDIRKELHEKLDEFATHNDSLEEIFENKEQIEVSKFYERLPKPHAIAIEEWLNEKYLPPKHGGQQRINHECSERKKILLGISGGIAAYKTPLIVRLLMSQGVEVKIVMTPAAKDFVTPLTLSTLSNHPVYSTFTEQFHDNPVWNDHVELGKWADLFLIAPATSNTLSAMVHAKCNNLLIATYLSCNCTVYIAPAMDLDMYEHPANQQNIKELNRIGKKVLPVGEGFLASGLHGKGRMLEPEEIISHITEDLKSVLPLYGKKVLITAGPTYEPIDPVRFIGNHSSGKMGFALAEEARQLGAHVTLISGPCVLEASPEIDRYNISTAEEMYQLALDHFTESDIVIAAAAVADFKPLYAGDQKIKKESEIQSIQLENPGCFV